MQEKQVTKSATWFNLKTYKLRSQLLFVVLQHKKCFWICNLVVLYPAIQVLQPCDGNYIIFCSDFRKVGGISKTDSYPIPRVDNCIDK